MNGFRIRLKQIMEEILRLEAEGEHRKVDAILRMASVVGDFRHFLEPEQVRKTWQAGELPEWEREERGHFLPFDWDRPDVAPPPELNLGKRIRENLSSGPDQGSGPISVPFEPTPPEKLHIGFIAPDGKCYELREGDGVHDSLAKKIWGHHDPSFRANEDEELNNTGYPWKAALQKRGWISYAFGQFHTLSENETHSKIHPQNLTSAQVETIRDIFLSHISQQRTIIIVNPYLRDIFESY